MITVIDNYDSFTWNLVQLIEEVGGDEVRVVRNDRYDVEELLASRPEAIVISPGPGTPARAGRVIETIQKAGDVPVLGICLGHQAIAEACGGRVVRGELPVHGKASSVRHRGEGLFRGCESPIDAARYHSLIVDRPSLPEVFRIDAETEDQVVMAISHRERPLFGIQFHPESFGTKHGAQLIRNFLEEARK